MATLVFGPATICAGGEHITAEVSVSGRPARTFAFSVDELRTDLEDDAIHDAALVILRLASRGRTRAQVRSAMQAGFTVTV